MWNNENLFNCIPNQRFYSFEWRTVKDTIKGGLYAKPCQRITCRSEKGVVERKKESYESWGEKVFRRWKEGCRVQRRAQLLRRHDLGSSERRVSSVEQRSFLSEELCLVTNWITNNMPDTHARMRLFFPAWCMHMKAVPMPNETRASARARSLQTSATDLSIFRKRCNFRYFGQSKIILAFEPIEIRKIDFEWSQRN